jgi:hypothetical protein
MKEQNRLAKSPPPSKSAERIKDYLEQIEAFSAGKGYATHFDIFRKAMNNSQVDRIIKYLLKNRFIEEFKEGYRLTELGTLFLGILRKHRGLVGVMTKELSGDRIKPYR